MLDQIQFPKSKSYRTGSPHEPLMFYLDCLSNAKEFDLLLGYFSSAAINVLSLGFAQFIYNGGKMRIVTNNILSEADKNAIIAGTNNNVQIPFDLTDIKSLKAGLNDYGIHFFKCLAYLIAREQIQIKIIKPKSKGIAHYKNGIFKDGKDSVSFHASCNFTAFGLLENAENLTCFFSKDGDTSLHKVEEDQNYFNEIFDEKAKHLEYLEIHEVKAAIKSEFNGNTDIEALLVEETELIRKKNKVFNSAQLTSYINSLEIEIDKISYEPKFPYPQEREIQRNAYNAWMKNDQKGIFAMATGSGKTITALNCVLKSYFTNHYYKAIIAVPTQALVIQWEQEVKAFNFQNVVSTHSDKDWKATLNRYTTRSIFDQQKNLILITTYATFNRKNIQSFLKDTQGIESFIYIADEVHNVGSKITLRHLPHNIEKRIGLSATPERIYDEVGSESLYNFFNARPPHYTYCYTMKEAINDGTLCKYDYYPLFVELTDVEMEKYKNITDQLRRYIDSETGKYRKEAEMLLLKRKRVVHKAENKKAVINNLLQNLKGKKQLDYTLVFVPEGYEPIYDESDNSSLQVEDIHIIDEYAQMFKEKGYKYHKYLGGLEDAEQVLSNFANGDIQVLLSMKCLDEGVDIPRAEHAIFCSSTGNPRQFVQRRGRVLRQSPGKEKATIWDLIVTPPDYSNDNTGVEKNMFLGEVKRVVNFAALAENQIEILYGDLKNICESLGINLFEMLEDEFKQ